MSEKPCQAPGQHAILPIQHEVNILPSRGNWLKRKTAAQLPTSIAF